MSTEKEIKKINLYIPKSLAVSTNNLEKIQTSVNTFKKDTRKNIKQNENYSNINPYVTLTSKKFLILPKEKISQEENFIHKNNLPEINSKHKSSKSQINFPSNLNIKENKQDSSDNSHKVQNISDYRKSFTRCIIYNNNVINNFQYLDFFKSEKKSNIHNNRNYYNLNSNSINKIQLENGQLKFKVSKINVNFNHDFNKINNKDNFLNKISNQVRNASHQITTAYKTLMVENNTSNDCSYQECNNCIDDLIKTNNKDNIYSSCNASTNTHVKLNLY